MGMHPGLYTDDLNSLKRKYFTYFQNPNSGAHNLAQILNELKTFSNSGNPRLKFKAQELYLHILYGLYLDKKTVSEDHPNTAKALKEQYQELMETPQYLALKDNQALKQKIIRYSARLAEPSVLEPSMALVK